MADGEISLREGIRDLGRDGFIAKLHQEAPIYRDAAGFWVASRFDDVRAILLDHAGFSSKAMAGLAMGAGFPLLTDDPPRHSMLRGLLAKAFTPASMEAMRPAIERLAVQLAAAIPAGQEIDVVEAITAPLPVAVIAGMMGVPQDQARDFKRWSHAIVGIQESPFDPARFAAIAELRGYFAGLAAERRAAPGEDLVSALTAVGDASETLSDQQVVGFCVLLMIAGNETTTNLLGNLISRLARQPEAWLDLRADPALIEAAIEESLRLDSPAQMVTRVATADAEIGPARIKAGDMVMVYLASANRDPARWDDAARFALQRERERHLAFGHGVHTCIGAPLARMEAKAAMQALVARFGSIERGEGKAERLRGGLLHGFRHLPVVFA
ncbi:MAG TPA: cytochrome P450 [Caulobacteraceae bacterium]|nr:cytochrome P450 [Caulobacteraceae bacterium]